MFSRFTDPLPLERRNDVVSLCPGWRVRRLEARARDESLFTHQSCILWQIEETSCPKQCVSKSSRALDAVFRAVRWRHANNRLGTVALDILRTQEKTLMKRKTTQWLRDGAIIINQAPLGLTRGLRMAPRRSVHR